MLGWVALAVYTNKKRKQRSPQQGDFICIDCGIEYIDCTFDTFNGKLIPCPECGGYIERVD